MARSLTILLLSALLNQVFCLQCNTCQGEYDCIGENVTCKEPFASCITSVRKAYVTFLEFQSVRKGCARQLYPHESVSLNSHLVSLSYQARYCAQDGCNNETYFISHPAPVNHMRCHTCASQGAWCPEAARTQISCNGDQDRCMDLDITGKLGQYSNMKMKGCTNIPRCEETLSFFSGSRTIHASCCDTPLCNTFTPDLHIQSQATNGLECYSCVDDDGSPGAGCFNKTISTVQCTGIHNMCLEGIGNSRKAGKDFGKITFKGCASPAMCQSSLLALVQELDNAEVRCCQGNFCNNRIVDGVMMEPGIPADSANTTEAVECVPPTPAGLTPDCIDTNGEENNTMVVAPIPAGVAPSAGGPIDREAVYTIIEKEGSESTVNESNAVSGLPHRDHSVTAGEHTVNENIVDGYTEGHTVSPAGATDSEHMVMGGPSGATNVNKSEPGASTTSSGNHGNVVVLVPIIVPKKNVTSSSSSSSSSSETSTSNNIVAASNNSDESEYEECEAEEEGVSTGDHFMAANEGNREGSASTDIFHENDTPGSTVVPSRDISNVAVLLPGGNYASPTESSHNTGVFAMEGHGSTDSPAAGAAGSTNVGHGHTAYGTDSESFAVDGTTARPGHSVTGAPAVANANTMATTSSPAGTVLVSGAAAGTSRPKNKIPCKRPGSQSRPGVILASSPGAGGRVAEEGVRRNATTSLFSDAKNPARNAGGKVHLDSGAFGLVSSVGLFSLTLLLAALLH
ncbi:uncharacterized protein LOC133370602 [Rhineura floridana]|uniref:uncharacterized protein LOC133370602 n=1 Tax=Rhineura floridana TaxID=261503 RepID=UPI002AC87519|nr:uncharacterized protein LOC133370602 [Rhineura floridana]